MDPIEQEIKSFVVQKRLSEGLGRRPTADYPTEQDFYRFVTDQMRDPELAKMLDHLTRHPADQDVAASARKLLTRMSEADTQTVPKDLLARVRSRIPASGSVLCPHCQKPFTPFKKPLARQRLLNVLWAAAGISFFFVSFLDRGHFVQWSALGALCLMKWIVDSKNTKTQILVYKALSESAADKTLHLHRTESHL